MNKVILIGRLTKDIELKNTTSQIPFCNFTLAVDRRFKDSNGQRQADFINCVAWRQTATFLKQYFGKGSKIAIVGTLQGRSFDDQSGQKRYITEVMVEEVEFVESKPSSTPVDSSSSTQVQPAVAPNVQSEPDYYDENGGLPFDL